jgi:hypothetical protein
MAILKAIPTPSNKINRYSANVLSFVSTEKQEEVKLSREVLFGVELEANSPRCQLGGPLMPILDLGIFAKDSSVDIEWISAPFVQGDWIEILKQPEYVQAFNIYLANNGGFNANVGMHVHVSRKAFVDDAHIYRFVRLFNEPGDWLSIAGRSTSKYARREQMPVEHPCPTEMLAELSHDRYRAVNVKNVATVEIRCFRSPQNVEGLWKYLFIAFSAFEYTKTGSNLEEFLSLYKLPPVPKPPTVWQKLEKALTPFVRSIQIATALTVGATVSLGNLEGISQGTRPVIYPYQLESVVCALHEEECWRQMVDDGAIDRRWLYQNIPPDYILYQEEIIE